MSRALTSGERRQRFRSAYLAKSKRIKYSPLEADVSRLEPWSPGKREAIAAGIELSPHPRKPLTVTAAS